MNEMNKSTSVSDTIQQRRMLAPAAYSEAALPALKLVRSSRLARRIGKLLFGFMLLATIVVATAPWQQSVKGTGGVIAYDPLERQQTIEAPIKGRIVWWNEKIRENDHVKKGDLIAEIADIDAGYIVRLQGQLEATRRQVTALQQVLEANKRNLTAAETVVESFLSQVTAYKLVKDQVVDAAKAAVSSARNKVDAENQQLAEQEAALTQVEADFERQKTLFEEGIASQLKYQEAQRKLKEAQAKVEKSKAYVRAAENEMQGKESDRNAKEQKAQVDIGLCDGRLEKGHGRCRQGP